LNLIQIFIHFPGNKIASGDEIASGYCGTCMGPLLNKGILLEFNLKFYSFLGNKIASGDEIASGYCGIDMCPNPIAS